MIHYILEDIRMLFREYISYPVIISTLLLIILYALRHRIFRPSTCEIIRKYRWRYLFLYLFLIYCFVVISVTILSRAPGSRDMVNWKLFETFTEDAYTLRYPIENILLFIPYGLLLPMLWSKFYNFFLCVGSGLLFSIAIEAYQYATKRGHMQTDDVLMNVLGTMIGYCLVLSCSAIRNKIKVNEMVEHKYYK